MGLALTDFEQLTPEEFTRAYQYFNRTRIEEPWEMARFLACCTLQPYSKRALKVQDVCRFSWDEERTKRLGMPTAQAHEESTPERWKEMMKRCGW